MFLIFFGLVMFYLCLGWSGMEGNVGIVEYVSGGAGKKDQNSVFFLETLLENLLQTTGQRFQVE